VGPDPGKSWEAGKLKTADSGHMFLLVENCSRPLKTCHFLRAAAVYFKIGRVATSPPTFTSLAALFRWHR